MPPDSASREGIPERRRSARSNAEAPLRILWQGREGEERIVRGRLIDVSAQGIALIVDENIPAGARVTCNEPQLKISGNGTVRYSRQVKGRYRIGIEFNGGTGWDPVGKKRG